MINLAIVLICVLLIVTWTILFFHARKIKVSLAPIIIGASFAHTLFLIVLPTVHSVWSDFMFEEIMFGSVGSYDILEVLTGELIFVFMFATGFVIYPLVKFNKPKNKTINFTSNAAEVLTMKLLIFVGFLIYLVKVYTSSLDEHPFITHLTTMFWYAPLVVSVFLLVGRNAKKISLFWYICAALIAVFVVYITFQSGIRGRIFWIFSLVVFAAFYYNKTKYLLITIPFLMVIIPIFAVFGTAEIRSNVLANSASPIELASSIYNIASSNSSFAIEALNATLESFAFRAQGVRNSAVLYNDHKIGGGGLVIYLGVLTVFIPTYLFPGKPILGSLSSSVDDFAMYKVIEIGYGRGGEMGPLLASAHAYWEGGWFWLVFCGFITGIFWKYLLVYSSRLPEIIRAIIIFSFGASFLVDGFTTMLSPIYAFIYMFIRSVMPILLIYLFFLALIDLSSTKKNVH